MRKFLFIATALFFCSCTDDGDFVNHKLTAEKSGDCSNANDEVKMVSNTSGQRFTFNKCLADGYDAKNYTVARKGDTVLVVFPKTKAGTAAALYQLTLDIDAKPRYNFIQINDQLIGVVAGGY